MASYRLAFEKSDAKDLCTTPDDDVKPILNHIESLCEYPGAEGYAKLSGEEKYRVGVTICMSPALIIEKTEIDTIMSKLRDTIDLNWPQKIDSIQRKSA